MRGIAVKFFSVPLPVWLKHRCRNWQNCVLFLPCYISWAVPTICSSLIFLSVISPFACSFRYMCDTAHLLKSAGDHYGLSQWSQSLEGWNWDLLRQLLVQNGCLSFFFLKKKPNDHALETLSVAAVSPYRLWVIRGSWQQGSILFQLSPFLSYGFIGHAVWVLFLFSRNQRPYACSIATWTCAAPSYSTTWGWDPRWWWGCESTCVTTMVSKVLEEQCVANSIVEVFCSFLLLGLSTKQL